MLSDRPLLLRSTMPTVWRQGTDQSGARARTCSSVSAGRSSDAASASNLLAVASVMRDAHAARRLMDACDDCNVLQQAGMDPHLDQCYNI